MRSRLVLSSVGMLILLTIAAVIWVVRGALSFDGFSWAGVLVALIWSALACGQWRTRGGWQIPIIIVSATWLVIALATFYLSLRMKASGWTVDLIPAIYAWTVGIVLPSALIAVNLRLNRRDPEAG